MTFGNSLKVARAFRRLQFQKIFVSGTTSPNPQLIELFLIRYITEKFYCRHASVNLQIKNQHCSFVLFQYQWSNFHKSYDKHIYCPKNKKRYLCAKNITYLITLAIT